MVAVALTRHIVSHAISDAKSERSGPSHQGRTGTAPELSSGLRPAVLEAIFFQRPPHWTPPSICRSPQVLTEIEVIEAEAELKALRRHVPRGGRSRDRRLARTISHAADLRIKAILPFGLGRSEHQLEPRPPRHRP